MEFEHFLITRFNLKKSEWIKDKYSNSVLNETWLEERINLFLAYCLPSVVGQTNRKFKWLIFFEESSREKVEEVLIRISEYTFIDAVFVNGYEQFQSNLPFYVEQYLNKIPSAIITSRLDNDDALGRNYIEKVQDYALTTNEDTVLYFPNGLVLDVFNEYKLAEIFYPNNQFLTLIEEYKPESLKTVYFKEHNNWKSDHLVLAFPDKNLWLQIVHSSNMLNKFSGNLVFPARLNNFSIEGKFKVRYTSEVILKIAKSQFKKYFRLKLRRKSRAIVLKICSNNKYYNRNIFRKIYLKDSFNNYNPQNAVSKSGPGSDLIQTREIIVNLPKLLKSFNVKSILDIPCGDFYWMRQVDVCGSTYLGADIVPEIIDANKEFIKPERNFEVLDILNDPLPKVDLILCRDLMVHLTFDQISKVIANLKRSGSKYLLTTSFKNRNFNTDIDKIGDWRPINLEKGPFHFPKPLYEIFENCTEGNGKFKDKYLMLFEIKQI